ncbi:VC0807 family protein [Actinoallomurus acaciae]|uniref:VC0807 family protein n=1 Tax=Actinoallomurus acaciae TaxID=502577 RepID=A0ABV5Y9T6_9ACTN
MSERTDEHGAPGGPLPAGNRRAAVVWSVVVNGAVPLLAYLLCRPWLPGDVSALAIAMAVPVAGTLVVFAWRRRMDPIGVIAVLAYGVALVVALLSGGDPFVLKLQEAVVTGPLGLILLVSAAVRRPALLLAVRLANRRAHGPESPGVERRRRHASTVLTAIMGGTLVVHALTLTILALTLTTAQVLAVSRLTGLAVLALGLLLLLWYRGRLQSAASHHTETRGDPPYASSPAGGTGRMSG